MKLCRQPTFGIPARIAAFAVSLVLLLPFAGPARSQNALSEANAAALEAYMNQETSRARLLAGAAADIADTGIGLPEERATAYSNLGLMLASSQKSAERALQLYEQALSLAQSEGFEGTETWLYAAVGRANLLVSRAEQDAHQAIRDLIRTARGQPVHAQAAGAAADLWFLLGEYDQMTQMLQEMLEVEPVIYSTVTLDELFRTQRMAQGRDDIPAVADLIDARILLAGVIAPEGQADFAHVALWTKFQENYDAQFYGEAADALRDWAATGSISPKERDFLLGQATGTLQLAQGQYFAENGDVQLGFAELVLAYAELATRPGDPRIGFALRERAAAETALGQYQQAAETLQRAISILEQSEAGRRQLYLVLEDLAANAWQRDDLPLAADIYDQAEANYAVALSLGGEALPPIDLAIVANNRARLAVETGDLAKARGLLETAFAELENAGRGGELLQNNQRVEVDFAMTAAMIEGLAGNDEAARNGLLEAVVLADALYPADHPDRALTLTNAADALLVMGDVATAETYLREAERIAAVVFPPDAGLVSAVNLKLVMVSLLTGDESGAVDRLRTIAEARQAPDYRDSLSGATSDFEMLAWALLRDAEEPSPEVTDEAIRALQWSQNSQSAQAVALLEARLMQEDAGAATLVRARQDLERAQERNRSAILAAYAMGPEAAPLRRELLANQAAVSDRLDLVSEEMVLAGLDASGVVPVVPMSLTEIQAALAEDEVLVTFLLPGLRADVIPLLNGSSNSAIAITRDTVRIAAIPEAERGSLRSRIAAFRCQVAPTEEGCGTIGGGEQRGTMLDDPEPQDAPTAGRQFDTAIARALYDDLLGGLDPFLTEHSRLIVAPPSDMLRLPFGALVTGPESESGEIAWLIRDMSISVIPSISSLRLMREAAPSNRSAPSGRFLGVGDPRLASATPLDCATLTDIQPRSSADVTIVLPQLDRQSIPLADPATLRLLSSLPDTVCELEAIADSIVSPTPTLLLGEEATETRIKEMDKSGELARYGVLHFATHGLVAGEAGALAPGLVLTPPDRASARDDGLLTAAEIANLNLNAALVVLSACNTAAGDTESDEGLSGLARAFFAAGAQSIMVTQWAVYSASAVEISTGLFLEHQADPGIGQAEALQRSILRILDASPENGFRRHPAYWAAYTMIGAD